MSRWKEYLAPIYFAPSHPGSFGGPVKLFEAVKAEGKFKIGKYKIAKWLRDQDAYSLTKGVRRNFDRSRVIVEGLDSQWDVDLMDMKELAVQNDGYRYVLVAIDIFFMLCLGHTRQKQKCQACFRWVRTTIVWTKKACGNQNG